MKMKTFMAVLIGAATGTLGSLQAQEAKSYPLQTCVVSGEKLGEMGPTYEMVYQEKVGDKTTPRLVKLCCQGCEKTFNKEPAKYLGKLNDAEGKKS